MRPTLVAILFLVTSAPVAAAQQAVHPALRPGPVAPGLAQPELRLGTDVRAIPGVRLGALEPAASSERSTTMRALFGGRGSLLHVVGGAVVGAWVGYFVSQVLESDWDRSDIDRAAWAAGGAVVGSVSGFAVSSVSRGPGTGVRGLPPTGRNLITTAEIRQSGQADAYSVIMALRPDWLITRGTHSMRETPRGQVSGLDIVITDEGTPSIKVYLNSAYLGGIGELRQIPAAEVTLLEYLNPAEATQRFGAGHTHGAIIVHTG